MGLLVAETTALITPSVKSRKKSSTATAAATPPASPPSQKVSRFRRGLLRAIKNAVIPMRTGSIAASSDSSKRALHIDAYLPTQPALQSASTSRTTGIPPVLPIQSPRSVLLAAIRGRCQHHCSVLCGLTPNAYGGQRY